MNKIIYVPNIIVKTTEYLGDHSREISVALSVSEETTIKELMELVFEKGIKDIDNSIRIMSKVSDHIEIRCANLEVKNDN